MKKKKWVDPEIKDIEIKDQEWKGKTGCAEAVNGMDPSTCCW